MLTTWKYRIKESGGTGRKLNQLAWATNTVWNFCKETQVTALRRQDSRFIQDKETKKPIAVPNFLSSYELQKLTTDRSRLLGLHSQTIQYVCEEYVTRRKQFKCLLRWRGRKSLGWVPFKAS